MQPTYSDRIVAFIDILGFGGLVRKLGEDPSLRKKIHSALVRIRNYKNTSLLADTAQSKLEVSVFSDSIVISAAANDIHSVIWSAMHLQGQLLALGILLRGGIACGRTEHANDILYGEGMLNAYHLESKAAVYPRIVLSPQLIDLIKDGFRVMFLKQDSDALWFIDPFSIGILQGNAEALLEDGYDPHEESLKNLGAMIDHEISLLSDASHLAKWSWLKRQHASAVTEYTQLGKPRFWHIWAELEKKKKAKTSATKASETSSAP